MRVLVVDDHQVVRQGVRSLLEREGNFAVCGEAVDGRDAIAKATELQPDAIVMDVSMPVLDGLGAAREIRRLRPQAKILILTQHDIPEMMKQAINVGAHGYVVKSAVSTELVAALDRICSGSTFFKTDFTPLPRTLDLQEIVQRSVVLERALRESEERLRLAQQIGRVGTFEYNVKTGVNRWTAELEALYGLRPGTFPGTQSAWEQLIHPDDREDTVAAVQQALSEGSFEREWRIIWPDGSIRWIWGRAFMFRDDRGAPERLIGANIDITDRKRSQAQAERGVSLLDLSFEPIVVRDANDAITYWNRGAADLYGWTAGEAAGQVTHTLLQTVFPVPLASIQSVLQTQGRWQGELVHSRKDGSRVTVMSRWATFRDSESGEQWTLETNNDITWQKAAEEKLKSAIRELEQRLEKQNHRHQRSP
jgi:PAS domain S-box-containing protein